MNITNIRLPNKEIDVLEQRLHKQIDGAYTQALKEMQEKFSIATKMFAKTDKAKKKAVKEGKLSEKAYKTWREKELMTTEWMKDMIKELSDICTNASKQSADIINDHLPDAYASGRNYSSYQIESNLNASTSFTLVNANAVRATLDSGKKLYPTAKVKTTKDLAWNRKNIRAQITQGIIQGESIDEIASRLSRVVKMSEGTAFRMARTMVGAAENIGHYDNAKFAEELGIKTEKIWIATPDLRTRDSHRHMDLERVPLDEPFSNDLMFPKDVENGAPAEIYNCRCRMVSLPEGIDLDLKNRFENLPDGMSYEDWKAGKKNNSIEIDGVVNGKDIIDTWQRRPEFDFEIEDAINAQGFDGKPRIVDEAEFEEYVKQANDGNGFVAQRSYSAETQEILDQYRKELYDGKWYVDCSTGGAQYGQGMYCAADYTGKISDGIKAEMQHYRELGESRYMGKISAEKYKASNNAKNLSEALRISNLTIEEFAKEFGYANKLPSSYTETITLDKSAKIIPIWKLNLDKERTVKKLEDEMWDKKLQAKTREESNKIEQKYDALITRIEYMDDGTYATLKGYDAINAENHGKSGSYTVILNRTKVIIKKPKGKK